jgi:hypothetical protein
VDVRVEVVGGGGHVEVDDVADARDVDAARRNVRGDHYWGRTALERREGSLAL